MNNYISKSNYAMLICILFIYIFYPPIVPYTNLLLVLFSACSRLKCSGNEYYIICKNSNINLFIRNCSLVLVYGFTFPLLYSAICGSIVDFPHYIHLFNKIAVVMVSVLFSGAFIIYKTYKCNADFIQFLKCIFFAGVVESILCLLAFMFPTVKEFFVLLMTKYGGMTLTDDLFAENRMFGFAGSLVDNFGYGVGIISGIALYYGIVYNAKYIFISIFIIISALLNARTGVAIYCLSFLLTIIFSISRIEFKSLLKIASIFLLAPSILAVGLSMMANNEGTMMWLLMGVDSVISFIDGTSDSSNAGAMIIFYSKNFWELPADDFELLFGTGHSRYLAEGFSHTDCGYVNDIWFVGILGVIVLYGTIIYLAYSVYSNARNSLEKFIPIFVGVSFFLFNIKASALGNSPGSLVTMLLLCGLSFYQKNIRERRP